MCGIVAYVGRGRCRDFIIEGLTRLEYRGYDAAGFVCINEQHGHFDYLKEVGKVDQLKASLDLHAYDGFIGMGHTRWATHGVVDERNTHPHFNCKKTVAVVHNGIIEDHESLRHALVEEGHDFRSATDTEVMAHLLSSLLDAGKSLQEAARVLGNQLHGAFAAVFLIEQYPENLLLLRRRSPLAIGLADQEKFVASDPLVFSDKTKDVVFMPEESFCILSREHVELFDFAGNMLPVIPQKLAFSFGVAEKNGFEHFMLKEIYEQKQAIDRTVSFYRLLDSHEQNNSSWLGGDHHPSVTYVLSLWDQLGLSAAKVRDLRSLHLIGAGTSWHAGRIAQFFFELVTKIPTRVSLASEFCYMPFFSQDNSLALFITQSGETADTLESLRLVNKSEMPTVALTNVASSTIVREAGGALLMQAGPEISVCSTKAFSTQVSSLYWLAHRIALEKGQITGAEMNKAEEDLFIAAEVLETAMQAYRWEIMNTLAKRYAGYDRFVFLGRHISYPFALEAALKLKEISYTFAQCYPAGELKHGPLALIDERSPVVVFSVLDPLVYRKLVANVQEAKARKGHLVIFAFEGQKELLDLADCAFEIPIVAPLLAPLAMTGLMQFFVYQITKELGLPIDKPRNLAKSVTVE